MSESPDNDDRPSGSLVRDLLANERTYLAWLRTAANVMIVGLALARFGDSGDPSSESLVAGGLLVVTGACGAGFGGWRYRKTSSDLRAGRQPTALDARGPLLAAAVLVVVVAIAIALLIVDRS